MTENEFIKEKQAILKSMSDTVCITRDEAGEIVNALEELKQYHSIGTVEDFKNALKNVHALSSMYEKLSDKEVEERKILEQYKAIGTVEECRQVMEKMKPKSWADTLCDVWVRLFHEDWLK